MLKLPIFGKPEWFRLKRTGWGLVPVTWQGWLYMVSWTAVILFPFVFLLTRMQALEALTWVVVSIAALVWDVAQILRLKRSPVSREDELSRDDTSAGSHVATRHFDLHLRK